MGFLIAILLTLAMAGSILWVMPSAREKQLTEMRQVALTSGVRVRLLDEKTAHKLYPWLDNYRGFANYELPLPAGNTWRFSRPEVVTVNQENLHELDRGKGLWPILEESDMFSGLPDSVEAMTFYSHGVAILWREREGKEGAVEVCEKLKVAVGLELS